MLARLGMWQPVQVNHSPLWVCRLVPLVSRGVLYGVPAVHHLLINAFWHPVYLRVSTFLSAINLSCSPHNCLSTVFPFPAMFKYTVWHLKASHFYNTFYVCSTVQTFIAISQHPGEVGKQILFSFLGWED